ITLSGSTYSDTATIVSSGDRSMSYGLSDFWIVSLDASGTILWNKTLGGGGFDFPYSSLTDGINYYIGGNSPKESIIPPTMRTAPRKGHSDGWLVKLDNNGNILWDKSYGGDSLSDQGLEYLIKVPNSQNLMVAGYSNSDAFNDKSENGFGDNDFWILKIDPSGNLLWDKTIGGAQDDGAGFITAIDSTTYFIGGFSYSGISGNKATINYGDEDLWVIEIGPANLGLKTFTASNFNLYPNPLKDKITISGADLKQLQKIEITDLSGKVIFNTTNSSSNTNEISVSLEQLQTGTYFVRLIGENSASSYKIVKE
ncbi:MAG: T9SS type A sorting domain-containing protein, partial [Crocinitomicaceae bacterium]